MDKGGKKRKGYGWGKRGKVKVGGKGGGLRVGKRERFKGRKQGRVKCGEKGVGLKVGKRGRDMGG